jgi:hypothetical protein
MKLAILLLLALSLSCSVQHPMSPVRQHAQRTPLDDGGGGGEGGGYAPATYSWSADTTRNANGTFYCYVQATGIQPYQNGSGASTPFYGYEVGVAVASGATITAVDDWNFNGVSANVFFASHTATQTNTTWDVLGANLAANKSTPCVMPATSGKLFRLTVTPDNGTSHVAVTLSGGGGHIFTAGQAPLLNTCELVSEPVQYGSATFTLRQ